MRRDGLRSGRAHLRRRVPSFVLGACACAALLMFAATSASARVFTVGTFNGKRGGFKTIQKAVEKAQPGDWVLIGPGDYKEAGSNTPAGSEQAAGVLVTKPGVHIRGMDRNGVVIDGTKPGTSQCSSNPADQNPGPLDSEGHPIGRNGVMVFKTEGVSVENLTACNFLTGSHGGGNQIWFNFGDGSGKQTAGAWRGAFLSATTQFYESGAPFGSYGIFVSNTGGPGLYTQVYANNMADSDFYIGACRDCNTILDHAHAETSALGYSGTNSGGHLTIQNSEFNNNKSGFVSNSQNNDDAPSPQDGSCPKEGEIGPTGTHNCWLFTKNSVHDNNNPNVPTTGVAGNGPVGSGVVLSGDRNNIVSGNTIYNNGAWGILLVPYPAVEEEPPPALKEFNCRGGTKVELEGKPVCYYDDFGNEVSNNTLTNNGFFANASNVDLAEISNAENPGNCWHGNKDSGQVLEEPTSEPKLIQHPPHSECGIPDSGEPLTSSLGAQVACDSEFFAFVPECPAGAKYPRRTKVELIAVPAQTTMPNPCLGVPRMGWCPKNKKEEPPYPVPGSPVP
jgi:Periplasmic copper-binding protein (NosD)